MPHMVPQSVQWTLNPFQLVLNSPIARPTSLELLIGSKFNPPRPPSQVPIGCCAVLGLAESGSGLCSGSANPEASVPDGLAWRFGRLSARWSQ